MWTEFSWTRKLGFGPSLTRSKRITDIWVTQSNNFMTLFFEISYHGAFRIQLRRETNREKGRKIHQFLNLESWDCNQKYVQMIIYYTLQPLWYVNLSELISIYSSNIPPFLSSLYNQSMQKLQANSKKSTEGI